MSDTVEVALIRHGLPHRVEGVAKPDPGLTGRGFEQARAVAEVLVQLPVRTAASSCLRRARETAAPAVEKLGLDLAIHDDLAEFDSGADFYIPIEEMVAESDPRLDRWRELVARDDVDGPLAEFRRTATAAVAQVAAGISGGVAAVFCHGGVIGACVEKALGDVRLSLTEPHYGSITRITIGAEQQWTLLTYNEFHHIERLTARQEERHEFPG
ncbi:histidine phosphatase family protein [Mycobacterium vicinigordonae]|uniref:Histidine phosphatase family protein n=1 Tax=Mycobacterium vicinigordonae TaxID=1719132 RepID=A0A7D6IVU8_9MYCO|nr:histidine phosphatase family protein [Mycobacterium vicinigordonae]QLL09859.1 histidine phosphatase family protein [Mycobacterium vicinigordonae]